MADGPDSPRASPTVTDRLLGALPESVVVQIVTLLEAGEVGRLGACDRRYRQTTADCALWRQLTVLSFVRATGRALHQEHAPTEGDARPGPGVAPGGPPTWPLGWTTRGKHRDLGARELDDGVFELTYRLQADARRANRCAVSDRAIAVPSPRRPFVVPGMLRVLSSSRDVLLNNRSARRAWLARPCAYLEVAILDAADDPREEQLPGGGPTARHHGGGRRVRGVWDTTTRRRYPQIRDSETLPPSCVAVGVCDAAFKTKDAMPGWNRHAWAYHGDDGLKFHGSGRGDRYARAFGAGDVVGLAVFELPRADASRPPDRGLVYTLNGAPLERAFVVPAEAGDLFWCVGMDAPCVKCVVNVGTSRAFRFDVDVAEFRARLVRSPARRVSIGPSPAAWLGATRRSSRRTRDDDGDGDRGDLSGSSTS